MEHGKHHKYTIKDRERVIHHVSNIIATEWDEDALYNFAEGGLSTSQWSDEDLIDELLRWEAPLELALEESSIALNEE